VTQEQIAQEQPNVLRFSCRRGAFHKITSKKPRSRAPKAVSCKRLFGGIVWVAAASLVV
jgi:hypothetical protein